MALTACPECENKVSDAASSCPACGHPLQPTADARPQSVNRSKELFKAGESNFVLSEVAALSSVKTRNWIYLLIGLPLVITVIFAWMNLDWLSATGITVVGMILLGFIYVDEGTIASTGSVTEIGEDMEKVAQRYFDSMQGQPLVIYQGGNMCVNMHFSINPERVAEFNQQSSYKHILLYLLGAGAIAVGYQYQVLVLSLPNDLSLSLLYVAGGIAMLLGALTRKSALEVVGVGGARVRLYTRCGDVKKVVKELAEHIEGNAKAA